MSETTKRPAGEFSCPCNHVRQDTTISTTARLIAWCMWSFANEENLVWIKIKTIMTDIGKSRSSVERGLRELRNRGWIVFVSSSGRSFKYRMVWSVDQKCESRPVVFDHDRPVTNDVSIEQNREQTNEQQKSIYGRDELEIVADTSGNEDFSAEQEEEFSLTQPDGFVNFEVAEQQENNTETDTPAEPTCTGKPSNSPKPTSCPQKEILAAWAELMPDLPQPKLNVWENDAKHWKLLADRWKEGLKIKHSREDRTLYSDRASGIDWWRAFFGYLRKSDFLMNECKPVQKLGIRWVVNRTNFCKILDGTYHERR